MTIPSLFENTHTHTKLCRHASGTVRDYCADAVSAGGRLLGFTDHTPLPDGRWPSVRMTMDDLPQYCAEIDEAREEFPTLTVLKGMECDHVPEFVGFYRDTLLGERRLDYLIGAAHWFLYKGEWVGAHRDIDAPDKLRAYGRHIVSCMETGLFVYIAHPDVFGCSFAGWDADAEACSRDILEAAQDLSIPLEINGYGFRKPMRETKHGLRLQYPVREFWALASEYDVSVVVSSDAHRPCDVYASLDKCIELAEECGLKFADLDLTPRK